MWATAFFGLYPGLSVKNEKKRKEGRKKRKKGRKEGGS